MGAGIVGICQGKRKEWAVSLGPGSNNRAELGAIIHALQAVPNPHLYDVVIHTDSEWSLKCITNQWTPLRNLDLLSVVWALMPTFKSIAFVKVKGHSGHPENERADQIASAAARGKEIVLINVESQRYELPVD